MPPNKPHQALRSSSSSVVGKRISFLPQGAPANRGSSAFLLFEFEGSSSRTAAAGRFREAVVPPARAARRRGQLHNTGEGYGARGSLEKAKATGL